MPEPVTAVLFGAGLRGQNDYGPYALEHPEELRFVAVAEPNEARRRSFAAAHGIPPDRRFADWRDLAARGRLADVCLNATQDQMHHASSLAALDAGYDLLLEKPIAPRLDQAIEIVRTAKDRGRVLEVCHVLRYTAFFEAVHEIVASGRIGDVVAVEHRENVGFLHMAHSYVRGNWARAGDACPMILAKCCHDLDILLWNLALPVERVSSFGSLMHFRPERAPAGATARCTDDCPAAEECAYDARRAYLDPSVAGWPVTAITDDLSPPARLAALREGPYGKCVYHAGNDVVDHQVVSFELAGGATAVLVMQGHTAEEGRSMRYDGTRGTLTGTFTYAGGVIEIDDFRSGGRTRLEIDPTKSGHGGGDFGLIRAFVRTIRSGERPLHHGREALESHVLAHAAEAARTSGAVVSMEAFRRSAGVTG